MSALANVRRLLSFSLQRQHRCEVLIQGMTNALQKADESLLEVERQRDVLQQLLASHRVQLTTLTHAELLALLRRQAVIRRQIHTLALDRAQMLEQRYRLDAELLDQRQRRKLLQRKHMKYALMEQRLQAQRRQAGLRQEEQEIEDITSLG